MTVFIWARHIDSMYLEVGFDAKFLLNNDEIVDLNRRDGETTTVYRLQCGRFYEFRQLNFILSSTVSATINGYY